jgi:membrane protein DedA with SNARE-associated domain
VIDRAALFWYFSIFTALVAAGLGVPIPEELPIVTAGAAAGHASEDPVYANDIAMAIAAWGTAPNLPFPASLPWPFLILGSSPDAYPQSSPPPPLHWWIMLPLCILGVVVSDGLLYGMGRFWGPHLLETRMLKRLVSPQKRENIEGNFHRYGVMVLLFARFLPTIRSPIFIMAGIMRLPLTRFLLADGLYAIPGVSLLFFLAFWFGDQFRNLILSAEGKARSLVILGLIAGIAVYLFYHFLRHPVATGDPREELPVIGGQVAAKIRKGDGIPDTFSESPKQKPRPWFRLILLLIAAIFALSGRRRGKPTDEI